MSLAVIGATSALGLETAKVFARAGHNLLMISRDTSSINSEDFGEGDCRPLIDCLELDVSCSSNISIIAKAINESLDDDPYVLLAAGTTGAGDKHSETEKNVLEIIDVNFRNVTAVAALVSEELQRRKKGCLILLSSVAGDRGRQSNFIYGAAKAGLSVFAQGLRNKLCGTGVHVLTVKLGYVNTPMFHRSLGSRSDNIPTFLVGDPTKLGESIFIAARKKKNVVYRGRIWWLIMFLVRIIPEPIFKRLRL